MPKIIFNFFFLIINNSRKSAAQESCVRRINRSTDLLWIFLHFTTFVCFNQLLRTYKCIALLHAFSQSSLALPCEWEVEKRTTIDDIAFAFKLRINLELHTLTVSAKASIECELTYLQYIKVNCYSDLI